MNSASKLLDAIRDFADDHEHDPQLRPLLEALRAVAAEVEKLPGDRSDESPGMRAAREASAEGASQPPAGGAEQPA